MKDLELRVKIEFTPRTFWSVIPSVNINIGSGELELEWLCVGIYMGRVRKPCKTNKNDVTSGDTTGGILLPEHVEKYLQELYGKEKVRQVPFSIPEL